jgi:hypothetical protein
VIGLTAGLVAALAVAPEEPPLELVWSAPSACPDGASVLQRLDALAPVRPAVSSGLHAEGLVTPLAGGTWRLRLVLRGPGLDDARTIDAVDCTTLADVAALLLAIAVAPQEVANRRRTEATAPAIREPSLPLVPPARVAQPTPPPVGVQPDLDDAPPARPAARPVRRPRGALRLAGGAEIGAIPRWSPTAAVTAALLGDGWRIELAGSYSARNLGYDDRPGIGGRLQLASGAARGCGVPRWRRFEFPVCAGLELGMSRGVARGVDSPRPASDLWIAAQLAPGAVWVASRHVALVLALEVLIALRRPGFHVEALGELARAEPIGLRPTFGVELRFP